METTAPLTSNLLVVVDTDDIQTKYPKPSQNPKKPTLIDALAIQLFISGLHKQTVNSTIAAIEFTGLPLANIVFRAISATQNSTGAALIYGIEEGKQNGSSAKVKIVKTTRDKAVIPDIATDNGLPAIHEALNFTSIIIKARLGLQKLRINFCIYLLADNGNDQELYGYYAFDTNISIQ